MLPVVLAGIVLIGGASAEGQTVRVVGPDRLTVTADGIPLGDLLDKLSLISPGVSLRIDPADRAVPVSFVAEDVARLDAIWLALKASGLDFVMSSRVVVAGRAKKALEESARAAPERAEPDAAHAAEGKREAVREPPTADPPPPAVDEHDLVQLVVPVLPPAPPSVVERPGVPPDFVVTESMFDEKSRQPKTSVMLAQPTTDEFGRDRGGPRVSFTIHEDSVTITQPGFVPFKLRPDVRNRRLGANLSDIP